MIAGCEHGGVSNPNVEIPVENPVEEVTPSQRTAEIKQKRTTKPNKPVKKPRSKREKGGLYGCLSVLDA